METVQLIPSAAILIESMRDIGYTLETALADIIDNSIAAEASKVDILAEPDQSGFRIGILDNGRGMTPEELIRAMRPGSRNPLEERREADLGRFGLGLKTASFSQCRRLTVVTRCDGATSAATWDLDRVAATDDWVVEIPEDPTTLPWVDFLGDRGTLVIWERLDRLTAAVSGPTDSSNFARRMDEARQHLELVFHRFLEGERGIKKVRMTINGVPLVPFDPFHSRHPATIAQPSTPEVVRVNDKKVQIQTFTLPHHQKVSTEEWERYAGPDGYLRSQGFYLYRERRLIIHGTWFGLARHSELTKLTRVRIDMPNGLDAEWNIDVKKASAQLPSAVRERLRRIVETMQSTSKRVYVRRGKRLVDDNRLPVWSRIQNAGEIRYRINLDHPVVENFVRRLPDELNSDFLRILDLAGTALPMDALLVDLSSEPDKLSAGRIELEDLEQLLVTSVNGLLERGVIRDEISSFLEHAEPFKSNWQLTKSMLEELMGQAE